MVQLVPPDGRNPAIGRFMSAALSLSKCVDPLADKYPDWNPYNYTLNNPIILVDPTGIAADSSYTVNVNTGKVETTGDKGGNEIDYIRYTNGIPIPQEGAIDYEVSVKVQHIATTSNSELPRGEIDSGPGYRVYDVGTGGAIKMAYPEMAFMPLPKIGLLGRLGKFIGGLFEKSAAEGENVLAKTLTQQIDELVKLNGGNNSVTIRTVTKQIRYDLLGKAHNGIPTPHVHVYNKNFYNGIVRSITKASKEVTPITKQEIRIIRNYLQKTK